MKNNLKLILTAISLLSFSQVNFGQSPNLRTSSSFALFTSVGAFDNVGATDITGDIGTNVGALTGFPPGTIVGQINVVNIASSQAAIDVDSAYSYLNSMTCDSVIGTSLGNDQMLTTKVYCLGANSTLNGDLILDGQGDPDAVFIFKIDGTLSTSVFSNIVLVNSASQDNVFWQINGAFELGDSSIFRGTVIANGSINLLEGSSLFGRGLSRAGAIYLNNNRAAIQQIALPIDLLNFTVNSSNTNFQIDWSTASETNNDYFTIQRSENGTDFENLISIRGAGNSNTVLHYSAIDYSPVEGSSYYLLKQTDFDGKYTYSNLVRAESKIVSEVTVYPNPFSSSVNITINEELQIDNTEFRIYNLLGEEVMKKVITEKSTTIETSNLLSGEYFYKLINNNAIIQSGKLISQK